MPEAISNNRPSNKYSDGLDDGPNLGEDLSSGASFMTAVPNQRQGHLPCYGAAPTKGQRLQVMIRGDLVQSRGFRGERRHTGLTEG